DELFIFSSFYFSSRLSCSFYIHVLLGAFIAQMELGDYHPRHSVCSETLSLAASLRSYTNSAHNSLSATSYSLLSGRTCSLATPESDDDDDVVLDANQMVWQPRQTSLVPSTSPAEQKSFTLDNNQSTSSRPRMSTDGAASVRPEETVHLRTYAKILPHLVQTALQSASYTTFANEDPIYSAETCSLISQSTRVGPNWPYPAVTVHQHPAILRHIHRLHRKLWGWSRSKAESHFLRCATSLAFYGVDLHMLKSLTTTGCQCHTLNTWFPISRTLRSFRRSPTTPVETHLWRRTFPGSMASLHRAAPSGDCSNDYYRPCSFSPQCWCIPGWPIALLGSGTLGMFRLVTDCKTLHTANVLSSAYPSELKFWAYIFIGFVIYITFSDFVQLTDDKHRGRCVEIYDLQFSSSTLCCRFYRSFVDYHRFFRLGQSGMSPKLIGASSSKTGTFERLPDHRYPAGNERSRSALSAPNRRSVDVDGKRETVKKCRTWLLCWKPQDRLRRSASSTSIMGPMNEQPNATISHETERPTSVICEQVSVLEPSSACTHQSSASLSEIPSS
ncbi:hypothetical protein AHF37_10722, partial [Paragonimus kellicotti]